MRSSTLLLGSALAGTAFAAPYRAASRLDLPHDVSGRDQACNGFSELCGRKYSDVTFVGAHDSAFVGVLPMDNQFEDVADQLSQGIRFLQAQSHSKNNAIELCHTSCIIKDAGPLKNFLSPIKSFLDGNANEVVTLLLTNGDGISVSAFDAVFQAIGLASYAYVPSGVIAFDAWPTLSELISSGKRLVVFMDYHTDTSKVDYILDEFSFIYETPFDTTDPKFAQCTVDRPPNGDTTKLMGLVNHFLDVEIDIFGEQILIPDTLKTGKTNSLASITAQTSLCVSQHTRTPNFVLLDFISVGDALKAQKQLNGL
ncbi:tat pathway signal sequence [Ophiostoma piceae UAMH 11346]|uniref:Tat pathway signal sequence n=1 Tax=Ophiostoma piceae (strain UAMH 11346) TaxID=1262450 RepID=S3C4A1_OPHP1|nr:tat pathway signal sequence [Ophiostoma piceae UAMH 11346]